MDRTKAIKIISGLILGLIAYATPGAYRYLRPTPEEALKLFLREGDPDGPAEDQIQCPLVRAGPKACPLILERFHSFGDADRGYAVIAIGSLRCGQAAPLLRSIIGSNGKDSADKATTLEVLYAVAPKMARHLSRELVHDPGRMGEVAQAIMANKRLVTSAMTYWEAVICAHE